MLINISIQGGEISRILVLGYLCPCLVITKTNVDKLLEKPAKRWDSVVTAVVTALISVLVGALLGRLI